MQLQDFFDYKNKLVEDLLTTPEIVRLISDDTPMEEAPSLAYTQVFPYEYVPETIQDGHTFVCCEVDVQSVENKTFLFPVLYLWVFAHKSRLRLPEGGVRTDKLCCEIAKKINGSRFYGLGQLNLRSVRRFAPMTDFSGKLMTFYAKEFNRQYDGTAPIPSNRKRG